MGAFQGRLTRRSLLIAGAPVALGACAPFGGAGTRSEATRPDATPAPRPAPATLALHHRWDGALREPAIEGQLREFRERFPHLTVDVSVGREADGLTVIAAAGAAGGAVPGDVTMLQTTEAAVLAERGGLVFLDGFLTKEGVKAEETWFPAGLTLTRTPASGKTFALPLTVSGDGPFLFYNKHMLRAERIDERSIGTWDGLLAASRAITKPLGDLFIQVGFPYPAGHFPTWLLVNGVELLSRDGRAPAFNTPAARETLAYVVESCRAVYGGATRLSTFLAQSFSHRRGGQDAAFEQQRMAAWLTGPYVWQELPRFAPGIELGAARMPVNSANPRSRSTTLADGAWTWAIPASSKHPDDAWRLAKWLGLEDGHRSLMLRLGRPSMVKRVSQDEAFFKLTSGWPMVLETLQQATAIPPTPAWPKLKQLLELLPSDVLGARAATPEAALTAAETAARAILTATT